MASPTTVTKTKPWQESGDSGWEEGGNTLSVMFINDLIFQGKLRQTAQMAQHTGCHHQDRDEPSSSKHQNLSLWPTRLCLESFLKDYEQQETSSE